MDVLFHRVADILVGDTPIGDKIPEMCTLMIPQIWLS